MRTFIVFLEKIFKLNKLLPELGCMVVVLIVGVVVFVVLVKTTESKINRLRNAIILVSETNTLVS